MKSREQALQDALALAPEDRAFVVDQLERSLEKGGFASPEIVAAWAQEPVLKHGPTTDCAGNGHEWP